MLSGAPVSLLLLLLLLLLHPFHSLFPLLSFPVMTLAFPSSYHLRYVQESAIASDLDSPEYVLTHPLTPPSCYSPSLSSSAHDSFASSAVQVPSSLLIGSSSASKSGSFHGVQPQELYATKPQMMESSTMDHYLHYEASEDWFQDRYRQEDSISVVAGIASQEKLPMFQDRYCRQISLTTAMAMKSDGEMASSQSDEYQVSQDPCSPVSFADIAMTERQSMLHSAIFMSSSGRETHDNDHATILYPTSQSYKLEMMESSTMCQNRAEHFQDNLADIAMKETHGLALPSVPRQLSAQVKDFTQLKRSLTEQGTSLVVAPCQVFCRSDDLYDRNLVDVDMKEKHSSAITPLLSSRDTVSENAVQMDRGSMPSKGLTLTVQVDLQQQEKDNLATPWQIFCNDGFGGNALLSSPTTSLEADQAAVAGFWSSIYSNYNKVDEINGVVSAVDPASPPVSSPQPAEMNEVSSSGTVATTYTADSARGSCSPSSSSICILEHHSPSASPSPSIGFHQESSSLDLATTSLSYSLPGLADVQNYAKEKRVQQKMKMNRRNSDVPHRPAEATDHLHNYSAQLTVSPAKIPSALLSPLFAMNPTHITMMTTQMQKVEEGRRRKEENSGIELIELLTVCVEAISAGNLISVNHLLAQLGRLASPNGNSVQRLSAYFTEAIACRASKLWPQLYQTLPVLYTQTTDLMSNTNEVGDPAAIAWQALNQATPLVKFSQYTANDMILQAFEGEEKVHIIDLDLKQGLQWPSLFHSLATREGGPPKLIRLTGIGECKDDVQDAGDRLAEFAEELGLNLEFHGVVDKLEDIRLWMLHVKTKEAVAVNCILQLHRVLRDESGEEAKKLLALIHSTKPKVVAMVEQEIVHDCLHEEPNMEARFAGAIRYFAALFDALQEGGGGGGGDCTRSACNEIRLKVEEFLGAQIRNIVACEGEMRVERYQPWRRWRLLLEGAGFCNQRLSDRAQVQAQILLRMFSCSTLEAIGTARASSASLTSSSSYRILPVGSGEGRLTLAWLDQTLLTASAWTPLQRQTAAPPSPSPSPSPSSSC